MTIEDVTGEDYRLIVAVLDVVFPVPEDRAAALLKLKNLREDIESQSDGSIIDLYKFAPNMREFAFLNFVMGVLCYEIDESLIPTTGSYH